MDNSDILGKTVKWAESEDLIRAVILVGSYAEKRLTDELSDYDLSIFCTDPTPFIESDKWLKDIAPVWVSIPEQFTFLERTIPTHLVIFEGGTKVDFAFYPVDILATLSDLPDELNMGYKVLIDKSRHTIGLPTPTFEGYKETRPDEKEFHDLIKEFWFEAYHVAKYLKREDLWSVQFRLGGIHHHTLIKMICWNESAKNDWNITTNSFGKRLKEWVCEDT